MLIDATSGTLRGSCAFGRATTSAAGDLAPPFTDPRELAAYYFQKIEDADFAALQPLLADEYQAFSYGEGRPIDHYTAAIRAGSSIPDDTQPDQWAVEEPDHSTFVVARLRSYLPTALVVRRLPDGTLRLDPGPCALQLAAYWRARPRGFEGAAQEPAYQPLRQVNADDGALLLQVSRRFQDMADCVSYTDGAVMVSSTWTFWKDVGSLALDGLYWTAGDQRGPVRVVWTDAVTDGVTLGFPTPRMPYTVTMLLDGAPSGAKLHLHIDGLTIHDASGTDIVFGYDDTLSSHPYPDPNAPLAATPEPTATIDRTN